MMYRSIMEEISVIVMKSYANAFKRAVERRFPSSSLCITDISSTSADDVLNFTIRYTEPYLLIYLGEEKMRARIYGDCDE